MYLEFSKAVIRVVETATIHWSVQQLFTMETLEAG